MRKPGHYQALNDLHAENAGEGDAALRQAEPQNPEPAQPEYLNGEDIIEAARAAKQDELRSLFEAGRINRAEWHNQMGRWENDGLMRMQQEDRAAKAEAASHAPPENTRSEGNPGKGRPSEERRIGDRRIENRRGGDEPGPNDHTGDQTREAAGETDGAPSSSRQSGGGEITEKMQARLDRLHAAQAHAPPGWNEPARSNDSGGRGGGGR